MFKLAILVSIMAGCTTDADPAPDASVPFAGAYNCVTESNCGGNDHIEHVSICIDSSTRTGNDWALDWMNACEAQLANSCSAALTCAASCMWLNKPCVQP